MAIIRPLYDLYTAFIRPLYGLSGKLFYHLRIQCNLYKAIIWPLCCHYTAFIRPLYGLYTAIRRPLYGRDINYFNMCFKEYVRTSNYLSVRRLSGVYLLQSDTAWLRTCLPIPLCLVIGGPGRIVELDESLIERRKYDKGRMARGKWLLGGVERGSNECFKCENNHRDHHVLIPIIKRHVRPGTLIITDR